MPVEAIIELKQVGKTYEGGVEALTGERLAQSRVVLAVGHDRPHAGRQAAGLAAAIEDRQADGEIWPPISVLVPCYNEGANAEETFSAAVSVDYPDFEVIAINDGSRDDTAVVLDRLAGRWPRLRVVHLAANQGKARALNTGALLARHELLVCVDGDALLDPQALRWMARTFRRHAIGGVTGNPRIRNRSSLLGRLQVCRQDGLTKFEPVFALGAGNVEQHPACHDAVM